MSDQFLGEIRVVPYNFAPVGWALCNGQILPISQNTALFSLLGTNFGGNGTSNFGLPNLQGCFPMSQGNGAGLSDRVIGETGGVVAVTLIPQTIPSHGHTPQAVAGTGNATSPSNAVWAEPREGRVLDQVYSPSGGLAAMSPSAVGMAGSSQPHNNLPPYLVLNFIIALTGIFPPRS